MKRQFWIKTKFEKLRLFIDFHYAEFIVSVKIETYVSGKG